MTFLNSYPDCCSQATGVQYRLVVRDMSTLQILHLYTCLDQISYMDWSSDSLFILCAMYKRGMVQVGKDDRKSLSLFVCTWLRWCDSKFQIGANINYGETRKHSETTILFLELLNVWIKCNSSYFSVATLFDLSLIIQAVICQKNFFFLNSIS